MDTSTAKARLHEELEDLQRTLERRRESGDLDESQQDSTGALSSHDQHPADSGTTTFDRTRDLAIEERLEREIEEMEAALQRIQEGTYGKCEVCGKEIDPKRLRARPQARFCREHRSEAEE